MEAITIRSREPADDQQIVEIFRLASPEYPELTVEEFRGRLNAIPPGVPFVQLVAEQDSTIVGEGSLLQRFWTEAPGSLQGELTVHPDQQGRGIGSRLYEKLAEAAQTEGTERVYGDVEDDKPAALSFVERRGFHQTGIVARMSRLDVHQAMLDGYQDLQERLTAEGIRVLTLADLGADNEPLMREIHAAESIYSRDVPSSETFSLTFEQWRDFLFTFPGNSPETVFVALDGSTVIGTANLQRNGRNAGFNAGTGVLREYRGRGVARLLKLRQIEWARAHGVDYLYTGNDINNPRMYDINIRLGYQPLPSRIEVVRSFV